MSFEKKKAIYRFRCPVERGAPEVGVARRRRRHGGIRVRLVHVALPRAEQPLLGGTLQSARLAAPVDLWRRHVTRIPIRSVVVRIAVVMLRRWVPVRSRSTLLH